MNFFGRPRARSPAESVKALRDNIVRLSSAGSGESRRRVNEEITRIIQSIKGALLGEDGLEPAPDAITQVANEVYAQDIYALVITHMHAFEFEARKDACTVLATLLRRQIGTRTPTVEYLANRPDVIFACVKNYGIEDVALHSGALLKEMLRYEPLARILLYSEEFYTFPEYIDGTPFGTSCDAFGAMKECLTRHKPMVAQYLEANYDRFFNMYHGLVLSTNYVTKRQSLKLLGEILLDRANYAIMTRYISSEANLKVMMNFLRDKSKNIQFEAFHVFKVFVANPNKPPQISGILRRNKDKLAGYLKDFHNDKEDEQFTDEKAFLVAQSEWSWETRY